MWLGIIKHNGKVLSPVELITLMEVPNSEVISAKQLMEKIEMETSYWKPERGTIYPIMHRLTGMGLLKKTKTEGNTLGFRRTQEGTAFLRSSFDEIAIQLEVFVKYFSSVADSAVKIDPIKSLRFIEKMETLADELKVKLAKIKTRAHEIVEEDDWHEISIE